MRTGVVLSVVFGVAVPALLSTYAEELPLGGSAGRPSSRSASPVNSIGGSHGGVADLVICSQNLKLFGTFEEMSRSNRGLTRQSYDQKVADLVSRFMSGACDVVAVQEVIGKTLVDSERALGFLASRWRQRSRRGFHVTTAPPSEGGMTNGFIVALDRATVVQTYPYERMQLPKISPRQKPRLFSRPPFEIQIRTHSPDAQATKLVSVVNFHLKSKRGAQDDPTGLEWETYRMEMSEALRTTLEQRHHDAFVSGERILVALGDRNSNFDGASARILEGALALSSFAEKGRCRLSKRGAPLCTTGSELPKRLFSVVTSHAVRARYPGTYLYKGEYSWLDDILMPAESLPYARHPAALQEGIYDAGVVSNPAQASDHSMVYVKLNW